MLSAYVSQLRQIVDVLALVTSIRQPTLLEHEVLIDETYIHTTIIEEVIWPPRTDSKRIADASKLIRGWLADVGQFDDANLVEAYRSAERIASKALLAAACRYDDGWSHAMATMSWRTSEASLMLDYDDGRCPTRFCASSEEPRNGTLSIELRKALQAKAPVKHLVAERSILDPGPTYTFGPPPVIRIRSVDVSNISRLGPLGMRSIRNWRSSRSTVAMWTEIDDLL